MAKLNITALNIELTAWNPTKSHKNQTADLLNEIADIMGFETEYLCENCNPAIGYAFEENDISIIKEMLELAKTAEGRSARCKKYDLSTSEVIKKWFDTFAILAKHNDVNPETIRRLKVKMHKQTDFIILKKAVLKVHPDLEKDMIRCFFAPTDYFVDQEDLLEEYDKILFLEYILAHEKLSTDEICGVYWCFVQCKEQMTNRQQIEELKALPESVRRELIEASVRKCKFERALNDNEEYVQLIETLAKIEGGDGKLQDKKKLKPLLSQLVEVMDKEAEAFLTENDYNKGIPTVKKNKIEELDVEAYFETSREVLSQAISWYSDLATIRAFEPLTEQNIKIIEMEFFSRFGRDMF